MATTPTNLPIPSEEPRDLKFNAGKIDEFVSSDVHHYIDRFGVQRWTISGINYSASQAISQYGYITLDSFEDGATLTLPNQALRYEATGEYYRWDGLFPSGGKVVSPGSTPSTSGGVDTGAWISVGDASLRSALTAKTGAGIIGYDKSLSYPPETVGAEIGPFSATGATNKFSKEDRANRVLFSDDFGTPGTDSGNSINLALDLVRASGDLYAHGGRVNIPRGYRTVNTTILLDRTAGGADETDSFSLVGEGAGTSELRAGSQLSSVSAIIKSNEPTGNHVQIFRLADFSTRGGYNGVRLETASRGTIERVKIENTTNDGLYVGNSWVNVYSGILVNNAGGDGIRFDAAQGRQKTSTAVLASYCNKSAGNGWTWGFMNYSAAIAVASDGSGLNGHHIKNSEGFMMVAPGCEGSQRAGFFAEASTAIGKNRSVVIEAAFAHNNNLSNTGWANLLHLRSTDGTENVVVVKNSTSDHPNNGYQDVIVDGVGAIAIIDNCIMPNGVNTINGGYIDWVHHNLLINSIIFGAGTARAICAIRSTQGYNTTYGGRITVHAANTDPSQKARRTATYELLVNKSLDGTPQVTVMAKLGETEGNTNTSPSFTWSINALNQLVATTATATIASTFWFEISTQGQVVVSKIP